MKNIIVCVQHGLSIHVQRDVKILEENYSTKVITLRKNWLLFLKDSFYLFIYLVFYRKKIISTFTRFADYHSFICGLFSKIFFIPFVLVVGGYDAIWIPSLYYGTYRKIKSRFASRWAYRFANFILPVDASLVKGVNSYSDEEPRREGFLEYYNGITGKIITIPNSYCSKYWNFTTLNNRSIDFITVAAIDHYETYKLKGIDYFIELSRLLPQKKFKIVGTDKTDLSKYEKKEIPPNLSIIGKLTHDQLKKEFCNSKIYVILSLSEGMPNALCESMLCGCIPVGSNVNAIPNIIKDVGILVYKRDIVEMKTALTKALTLDTGNMAREKIVDNFPIERRKNSLYKIFEELK